MEYGLPPVVDGNCKVLILGSFPVPRNGQKQYYANPKNQFWTILGAVCDCDFVNRTYNEKKNLLLKNHIALWDFIETCERKKLGSADNDLLPRTFNDIISLIKNHPDIKKICINFKSIPSKQSEFRKKYDEILELGHKINVVYIPSPSTLYPKPLTEKIEYWIQEIKPFIL
jgi:hypoxanthine-DNA glycosylase